MLQVLLPWESLGKDHCIRRAADSQIMLAAFETHLESGGFLWCLPFVEDIFVPLLDGVYPTIREAKKLGCAHMRKIGWYIL